MENLSDKTPPKNWWSRNWKWFVPVGCLSVLIVTAGIAFAIISFILGLMKSSDVYREAVERAKYNAGVIEALGAPVEEGLMYTGKIAVQGDSGRADIAIPISGPKGKGIIHAQAVKTSGRWVFGLLAVHIEDTGERIDLLGEEDYL